MNRSCWFACVVLCGVLAPLAAHAQQSSASVYVRVDTDHTTVITPRAHVQAPVDDSTKVDVSYSADVWSSASVDIKASASKPVTERRDEINAAVTHEFSDARVSGAYRFSYEPDYVSHFVSLGLSFDFANKSATLDLGGGVSFDDVGRVGDPGFHRSMNTYTGQATFTQVVDPNTLIQAVYSLNYGVGFQSSPYRYIGINSWNGACGGPLDVAVPIGMTVPGVAGVEYCFPEKSPETRLRHAFVLSAARALGDSWSAKLTYRFYIDDWKLLSHTALAELNWMPVAETLLGLRYRFYLQSAAFHYRSRFAYGDQLARLREFYTRDKELSPFNAHRVALELEQHWGLAGVGEKLLGIVSVGPTVYLYDNFIPYKRIVAFEATISGVLVL